MQDITGLQHTNARMKRKMSSFTHTESKDTRYF